MHDHGKGLDAGGQRVLRLAVAEAQGLLGDRLQAAFALGSLAHGGFVPAVSDVDLALVVDRVDDAAAATIAEVTRNVRRLAAPRERTLAERLSIFWSDWDSLARGDGAGRFPATDRLDLLDSGRLLHGTDRRGHCAKPSRADLVLDSATFAAARFGAADYRRLLRDPTGLSRRGARAVTKTVLFPVRMLYTADTGRLGRNDDAVQWYAAQPRVASALVAAAGRWRATGIDDVDKATALLAESLVPLYRHCAERLSRAAAELGHHGLAGQLTTLYADLNQTT